MTMMGTLEAKGYLKKRADGRAFRYRPARSEGRVITSLVREFVDRVFDGASRPLLAHLVTEGRLTKEEREELKRLIDEAEMMDLPSSRPHHVQRAAARDDRAWRPSQRRLAA